MAINHTVSVDQVGSDTLKAQKDSKDIFKIVHVISTLIFLSYDNTFCVQRKLKYKFDFIISSLP